MEQSLRAQLDQRPMTTFQWSVVESAWPST